MIDGIEPGHPGRPEGRDTGKKVAGIQHDDQPGRLPDLRNQLFGAPFRDAQADTGGSGDGAEHEDRQAGTARQLQKTAKEQDQR